MNDKWMNGRGDGSTHGWMGDRDTKWIFTP